MVYMIVMFSILFFSYMNKSYKGGGNLKDKPVQNILKIFKYIYINSVLSGKIQSPMMTLEELGWRRLERACDRLALTSRSQRAPHTP